MKKTCECPYQVSAGSSLLGMEKILLFVSWLCQGHLGSFIEMFKMKTNCFFPLYCLTLCHWKAHFLTRGCFIIFYNLASQRGATWFWEKIFLAMFIEGNVRSWKSPWMFISKIKVVCYSCNNLNDVFSFFQEN